MQAPSPSHPTPLAELRHVTLRYESGAQALEDLSLAVRPGEHLCVLGANGSGKSTLASVLCGLLAPDEGTVSLLGQTVFDASAQQPIDFGAYRLARRRLGLVFQNPDDQIVTTVVEEDVAFGPENLGVEPDEIGRRVERELRRVAMQAYAKADPTRLSGGQKQRVAIAGALAMEPELIVLDEPGALLDVRGRRSIMRVMGKLRDKGTTVVHITHFMDQALDADRVIVLDHGHIVLEGRPSEVFAHDEVLRQLGLEAPYAALLSHRLGMPWTCDATELLQGIAERSGSHAAVAGVRAAAETRGSVGPQGTADARDAAGPRAQTPHLPADGAATGATGPAQPLDLSVRDVSYAYRSDRNVLDRVALSVARGSSLAIVGQTGSGKSTLLRLLCALEAPDSGDVLVGGISTRRKRDRRRLQGTIGYAMQHPERQLFAETVLEDVAFGPTNMGLDKQEVQRRCRQALDLVGLKGLDDASPFELSGGQQRLCAIAGILAMEPSVIVLDEPMAGLDPRGRRDLRRVLSDVHRGGVTVVLVTHAMEDAVLADQVVVLNQARVMYSGTPAEVFSPAHEDALAQAGLGLPVPLQWALLLQGMGVPDLGDPLTLEELAQAIERTWSAEEGR